jgi:hypothetical protein
VVREVVALDRVLRMSTGGSLEGGMHAERLQAVVLTSVVVQGEQPLLFGVQEDLTPSASAGIASTRCLCRRVYTDEACGRKQDSDEDHQQTPHEYISLSLLQLVSLLFSLFADLRSFLLAAGSVRLCGLG